MYLYSEKEPKYFLGIYKRYMHMHVCSGYLGFSNKIFLNLACEVTQIFKTKNFFKKKLVQVINSKSQKTWVQWIFKTFS